jgi:Domain of unknown function (DUF4258)
MSQTAHQSGRTPSGRTPVEIVLTEHARHRAVERGVTIDEVMEVLKKGDVLRHSKADPATGRYVVKYKDLRIVYELAGATVRILSIFAK